MAHWWQAWQFWAVLSAVFVAAKAIVAKLGVKTIHPDVATFIRTIVIVIMLAAVVAAAGGAARWPASVRAV